MLTTNKDFEVCGYEMITDIRSTLLQHKFYIYKRHIETKLYFTVK